MGYKMKYTNGKKADVSAFPFKIEAPSSAVSDSPAKFANVIGEAERIPGFGALPGFARGMKEGGMLGAVTGGVSGFLGLTKGDSRETLAAERNYADEIEDAGLSKNFFGKIGFGGGNKKARAALIKDLQEQDQAGLDRERIMARGGVTAGA
tara:strand:- start:422 stop:874 length:453 start_codon:yes stop_codon:yes gene_type:complete